MELLPVEESAFPEGLQEEDFRLAYETFARIAREAEGSGLLREQAVWAPGVVPLGLARVVDFAVLGWVDAEYSTQRRA